MNECIICEEVGENLVDKPTESSFETLLERTRERHRYRDLAVVKFAQRTADISPATLIENHATYHRVRIQLYNALIDEMIVDCKSIWDTMSKYKLPTFISLNIQIAMEINQELVKIKEERKLMSRFLVISRSRPEIDLSFYLGEYELSVVPRSLFSADGVMYQEKDKSVVVEEIRKLCSLRNDSNDDPVTNATRVIVFDGMAIVNGINISKSKLSTCCDFAQSLFEIILSHAKRCEEIRVIFDVMTYIR